MKVKPIKIKIKEPPQSAADRLYAKHQAIRKAKGLPDPSEYKKKLDGMKNEGYIPIVVPKMIKEPTTKKPTPDIGMHPAKQKAIADKKAGKAYKNPYRFDKNKSAPENADHNMYKATFQHHKEETEQLDEMPESSMKTRDVHSHLKKAGWAIARTGGGHDIYSHPQAKRIIAVPRHKQLKAPLIKGILKASKVSEETEIDEQLEKKGRFVSGPPKKTFKAPTIVSSIKEAKDAREYDYEGDMAASQLRSLIFNAQDLIDMMDDNTNLPEWVQSKITLAEDYISTAANYLRGELTESINEEVEYLEEKNAPTNPALWSKAKSLARSKFDVYPSAYANGWAAKWYKSKGGGWKSVNEEAEEPSMAARTLSRKAQIVKDAAKSKKVDKEEASDKFQKDPELSSDIQKT